MAPHRRSKQDLLVILETAEIEHTATMNYSQLEQLCIDNELITEPIDDNQTQQPELNTTFNQPTRAMEPLQTTNEPETEDDLDKQIQLLEKRMRYLQLKTQIEAMERGTTTQSTEPNTQSPPPTMTNTANMYDSPTIADYVGSPTRIPKFDHRAVEGSLIKFSGDDRLVNIHEFFRNFDDVMETVNAGETYRMICLKNALEGTARLLLRNRTYRYNELREKLI